jgi:hypothetical protein
MRSRALLFVLAALLSSPAYGQAVWQPTPPPIVTAESTAWFQNGDPVTWDGSVFVASGAMRPFDGNVMVRSGVFRGIPLYTDATLEANTVVLIPIARGWMQPYERRAIVVELETRQAMGPPTLGPALVLTQNSVEPVRVAPIAVAEVALADVARTTAVSPVGTSGRAIVTPARPVTTVIPPTGANTIWIEYDGRKWFAGGKAIEYDASRLNEVGSYRGWTVYALKGDRDAKTVYIPSIPGRLAPYTAK